jgi:hypothetical protein
LKVSDDTSGSGPTEMSNSSYCPGWIASCRSFGVQVMLKTPSVTSPSSVLSGVASFLVTTCACQPGCGFTLTEASGWSWGKKTCSLVVAVESVSFGTRKLRAAYPPCVAVPGSTVTCAQPGAATSTRQREANEARVPRAMRVAFRRVVRGCCICFLPSPTSPSGALPE